MELNADFTKRVAIHADRIEWLGSPTPGVSRRMLDRIGDEVARATTIVRYDPHSRFPAHVHGGGEEFVVLEGSSRTSMATIPPDTMCAIRRSPAIRQVRNQAALSS
jgi:anti-sigma factor ChrR (cupin superfamily)